MILYVLSINNICLLNFPLCLWYDLYHNVFCVNKLLPNFQVFRGWGLGTWAPHPETLIQYITNIPGHRGGILHPSPLKEEHRPRCFLVSKTFILLWSHLFLPCSDLSFLSGPCGFVGPAKIGSTQISSIRVNSLYNILRNYFAVLYL